MRGAERRRNRTLRHVEVARHFQAVSAARPAAEQHLLVTLAKALVLGVAAWLLIEIVLPLILQLAGAPFN